MTSNKTMMNLNFSKMKRIFLKALIIHRSVQITLSHKKLSVLFTRNKNHTIGVMFTPQFCVFSALYPSSEGNFHILSNGPSEL